MSDGAVSRAAPGVEVAVRPRKLAVRRVALGLLGLGAAAGAAWYGADWWRTGRFLVSTDDAYVGGDVTALAPRVAGLIERVAVVDNQAVRQGDLLVKLDDRDYRAALDRAAATVAAARAAVANLAATRRQQEAVVAEAEAEIAATDAEIARAAYDVVRYRRLASDQFASEQRFQQADADSKKAAAASSKARAALEAASRQLDVTDTATRRAEADLAQAIADRDLAALNVSYTELRAPVDGTVGNRSARPGAFAAAGGQLLAIVPARGLWVDANFKESQLARMRVGMPAHVAADAVPGAVFSGHVASLSPATGAQFSVIPPENATGNFTKIVQRVPVRILLDGDAGRLGPLRPGLSVTAEVDERGGAPAP